MKWQPVVANLIGRILRNNLQNKKYQVVPVHPITGGANRKALRVGKINTSTNDTKSNDIQPG